MTTSPRGNIFTSVYVSRASKVRKRSEDAQPDLKKGKLETKEINSEEAIEHLDTFESAMATKTTDLKRAMIEVLSDEAISDLLVGKFSKCCDEKIKTATDSRTGQIEDLAKATTSSIEKIDTRLENLEQDKRCKNLLVRGIDVGSNVRVASIECLNKHMQTKLKVDDIKYAIAIGKQSDKLVKLSFNSTTTRDEIYKKRSTLKGKDVWVTEDLTPRNAALFFKARQAVKKGKAALTWTNEGKIFVKSTSNAKPTIISSENDLPEATPTDQTPNGSSKNDEEK
jgi:hypothetical protein